ncbi:MULTISPECIES: hypothetical protein [Nocardiaceae]|uniref:EAL domain-containing protein n=1 Tax=Rhodococcoides kroppenstedtii TaxID=293050 RepID=A0ABS7NXC9_9NOCA|nr:MULTISPECIES: hypothetical protein [Rhodococcus]AMY20294.1 hypothetical protein A3Q40_02931 [Rhodococcus sp. PBTS 1]MBY6314945.1 hypothetical protein [Rhodococcus kroppenstedtii]MBY6322681.1 hypothetical protein [Rhodococcus kroppenstedtii]MBY6399981.1 hypothetical protein [Rhodococcus kroppenstedtii]
MGEFVTIKALLRSSGGSIARQRRAVSGSAVVHSAVTNSGWTRNLGCTHAQGYLYGRPSADVRGRTDKPTTAR